MTRQKLPSDLYKDDYSYVKSSSVNKDNTQKLQCDLYKDDNPYFASSSLIKDQPLKIAVCSVKRLQRKNHVLICKKMNHQNF